MIRQVVAFVENKEGIMRQVSTTLRESGVRLCGLSTVDSPEFGIIRMMVDEPDAAIEGLEKAGFVVKACEVIAIGLETPGQMEAVLQVVEDGNVNINYFYSSFGSTGERPILILNSADMEETEEMLRSKGFSCLE
ncbi:MAG: amino acid-binding protein [Lachnospiraceae bacterium]|nr:amino acid-binding protein [Lachnospiraceae bacterium]